MTVDSGQCMSQPMSTHRRHTCTQACEMYDPADRGRTHLVQRGAAGQEQRAMLNWRTPTGEICHERLTHVCR